MRRRAPEPRHRRNNPHQCQNVPPDSHPRAPCNPCATGRCDRDQNANATSVPRLGPPVVLFHPR
jgi:hypothetical protein